MDPIMQILANNVMPTQGGAAAAACHEHGLEVEHEGFLKDLVVIFIFLGMLCTVCFFLMPVSYSHKKSLQNMSVY
jgi:hypothetical protein